MKITYEDKINATTSAMPRRNKATADDFNEIKEVVNNNIGELLWTNENPTSDFSAQTIDVEKNTFQFYRIAFKYSTVSTDIMYKDVAVGDTFILTAIVPYTPGLSNPSTPMYIGIGHRPDCSCDDESITIATGYQSTTNSSTKQVGTSSYAIPLKIWGYNLT